MPKITITEVDLTSPGSLDLGANIVYVPGAAKDYVPKTYKAGRPILYESLQSFINDWGKYPATLYNEKGIVYDTGYIYAAELLRYGTPVLFDCVVAVDTNIKGIIDSDGKFKQVDAGEDFTHYKPNYDYAQSTVSAAVEDGLKNALLEDKGLCNIKIISTGGYVSDTINLNASNLATARQDCVAILDHLESTDVDDLIAFIEEGTGCTELANKINQYTATFTPYAVYQPVCCQGYVEENGTPVKFYPELVSLPASFGYLMALANATNLGSQNWLAMAGATRGVIPNIVSINEDITTAKINKLQSRNNYSINPICMINPFGIIVWGNRTGYNNGIKGNLVASSFLNIRNLVSEVKKTVWVAARQLTFEQNSDILWVNFKSLITPTLDRMVTGGGLSNYELKKRTAKAKATLCAVIRLYAIEAVEDFEIEIQLADDTTAIIE